MGGGKWGYDDWGKGGKDDWGKGGWGKKGFDDWGKDKGKGKGKFPGGGKHAPRGKAFTAKLHEDWPDPAQDETMYVKKRLKLFVNNIPSSVDEDTLQLHFQKYGPLLAFSRADYKKGNYCFVTYQFANDCDAAAIDGDKNFPGAPPGSVQIRYQVERELRKEGSELFCICLFYL